MNVAVSRYKTRRIAVQCLYAWAIRKERPDFAEMLNGLWMPEFRDAVDLEYFAAVTDGVPAKEAELAWALRKYAPKFGVDKMPAVNVMAMYVAMFEMLFWRGNPIPEKVSIDEAIEVCRLFSDDSGKALVNGVLNAVKENRAQILASVESFPESERLRPFFPAK